VIEIRRARGGGARRVLELSDSNPNCASVGQPRSASLVESGFLDDLAGLVDVLARHGSYAAPSLEFKSVRNGADNAGMKRLAVILACLSCLLLPAQAQAQATTPPPDTVMDDLVLGEGFQVYATFHGIWQTANGGSFQCAVFYWTNWQPCSSSKTYQGLPSGSSTAFLVRAIEQGRVDRTPAWWLFTVP
jgi:hypothetical protein